MQRKKNRQPPTTTHTSITVFYLDFFFQHFLCHLVCLQREEMTPPPAQREKKGNQMIPCWIQTRRRRHFILQPRSN